MTQQFALPPVPQYQRPSLGPVPEKLPIMPPLTRKEWDEVYDTLQDEWEALDEMAGDGVEVMVGGMEIAPGVTLMPGPGQPMRAAIEALGPIEMRDPLTGQLSLGSRWQELWLIDSKRTLRLMRDYRDLIRREERKAVSDVQPTGAPIAPAY